MDQKEGKQRREMCLEPRNKEDKKDKEKGPKKILLRHGMRRKKLL